MNANEKFLLEMEKRFKRRMIEIQCEQKMKEVSNKKEKK